MKNWHTEKFIINDTNVNFDSVVPITELMKLFQIATFNHSQNIQLDHKSMEEKSNAFWVVTKMKLCLKGDIHSQNKVSVTTWTHPLGAVRAFRDCVIKCGNSIKVKGLAEWCCLDLDKQLNLTFLTFLFLNLNNTTLLNL